MAHRGIRARRHCRLHGLSTPRTPEGLFPNSSPGVLLRNAPERQSPNIRCIGVETTGCVDSVHVELKDAVTVHTDCPKGGMLRLNILHNSTPARSSLRDTYRLHAGLKRDPTPPAKERPKATVTGGTTISIRAPGLPFTHRGLAKNTR